VPIVEGRDHGGPVERLTTRGVDAVNGECLLGPLPADEHGEQHDAVEDARHRVGDAEADVEHVGGHGAEHADHDHGQPVRPRDVAAHRELQREGGEEADEPQADGRHGYHRVDEVVGGRLAHRG
jgi:hypothetical protein